MWEWVFDGIGTELVGLALGAILGGLAGYNIGIRSKSKQIQKAGDGANQQQTYTMGVGSDGKGCAKVNSKVVQSQTAGNNATQIQTGGIKNE